MDKKKDIKAAESFPGVDTDLGENNKVTPRLVKQETKELNNNPRNNDIDE